MLKSLNNCTYNGRAIEFPGRIIPLHSMLTDIGLSRESSHDYRWHGLERGHIEFAIWQYTISGKGALEMGGKVYEVNPGDAMLLHVPQDHCYFLPADSDYWEFLYLNVHGSEVMRIWREIGQRMGPVAHFGGQDDKTSPTVELVSETFKKCMADEVNSPHLASSLGYQFVMTLMDELMPGGWYLEKPPDFVDKVTKYAMNNLHESIGVDDLAEVAGYSRFHFSRVFKKWYGDGPSHFLHEMRMKRAVRLLQTERKTIKEIADRCGFTDTSYFCKVFRKEFDISPEKFRNRKQD